jgi:hypothetical protein
MTPTKSVLLLAASGLALTLGGCKIDNRPLLARFTGRPPPAAAPQPGLPDIDGPAASPASYLAPPPPPLPPAQAYPYAERARAMDRIVYQAPPAYGFAYGGEQPWAWQAADDGLMFAEPYGDDYRFYYYEPGAAYPYFVRDAGYGYAYGPDGGVLAMFDAAGALIAADQYGRYYPDARRYWSRGSDLQRAYESGRRYPVDPGRWAARAPRVRELEQGWIAAPQRQAAWRDWRATQGERYARADAVPLTAAPERRDNGRHLGWERGRHVGWDKQAERAQVAAAAPPPAPQSFGRREDRPPGRPERPPQVVEPHADQPHGRGHGPGRGGGGQFAQAAPAPQGVRDGGGHGEAHDGGQGNGGGGGGGHGKGGEGGHGGGKDHGRGH